MNLLEIFFGLVPEAIYFSLFMVFAKELKTKRILFILIMIFEYIALKHFIKFNVLFQFIYTFMVYLNFKVLYKDKAIITDLFVFMVASLVLILLSGISYILVNLLIKDIYIAFYVSLIINRISLFSLLIIARKKLPKLYNNYKFFWNRHKDKTVKIRSLTLRNISVILFNLMFYIINIGMLIALFYGK